MTFTNDSRSLVANAPISDYMRGENYSLLPDDPYYDMYRVSSGAASDRFNVSAGTYEGPKWGHAWAHAISDITFSPQSDEVANLTLGATVSGNWYYYTAGFVSLVDLTSAQPLWYYAWNSPGSGTGRPEPSWNYDIRGTIPLASNNNPAFVTQETSLTEGHQYELVMYSACDANGDWEGLSMNVLGLEVIPEPSSLTLLGLGSLALVIVNRRK
jgi:hypothetical protein